MIYVVLNTKVPVSVGIPAYSEEGNISNLLSALLKQSTDKIDIREIIVVSSGSTDKTDAIVEKFSEKEGRLRLIKQPRREGKASAINEFLKAATNDILVLESADTIPAEKTIEELCDPFEDNMIGMTAAHPKPVNDVESFMGYIVHLLWNIHHQIALKRPKCGELIAFRRVLDHIPKDTVADESWMEYQIKKRGYRVVYVSEAIVYNKGPETVGDLLTQRRRIAYGHLDLRKKTMYEVSSWSPALLLSTVFKIFPYRSPREWGRFLGAFTLESLSRLLGFYDYYIKRKRHEIWGISSTSKRLKNNVS